MKILNLDSIKASANIVQVVQSYLPLQKVGSNHKACCPFHAEQTPSFVVNEAKQIFHCFGCGEGGDVFSFVQKHKKVDFIEAVEMVANALNITIEYDKSQNPQAKSKYKDLLEVNEAINEICKEVLANDKSEMVQKCREYLKKRGLNTEDFSKYEIGFVPRAEVFFSRLNSLQFSLAKELGFIRTNKDKEGFYAPLSERISFALRNHIHKVAGFSARSHPYKNFRNAGKYINSSESEVFKKSQILYRYSSTKSVIYSTKSVYVVEGFMDTIALDKLGIKNAVATCGVAFSLAHLSAILSTPEVQIVFCFDKDEAGGNACVRSLELCYKAKFYNTKVAWATNEVKDFGEVLERGEELKLKELKGFDFYLRYKIKKAQNNAQKQAVLDEARRIIDSCELYYEKCSLIEQAQAALKIPLQYLQSHSKNPQNAHKQAAPHISAVLLKSALFDEKMAFILREVVSSEGLEILANSKGLYEIWANEGFSQNPKSKELNALSCDERVRIIIDNRAFSENLKALQIQNLKEQITLAKEGKNIDLLLALQEKLSNLQIPF